MYIFSRSATLKPEKLQDGTAAAIDIAALITSIHGHDVNVYTSVFGAPAGSILWSMRIESQAELADLRAKTVADPRYIAAAKKLTDNYMGPMTDALAYVVSSTLTAPKPIVMVTQATIANAKMTKAMEVGVALQEHVGSMTGLPTAFCSDSYGVYGQVRWLVSADTMADVDNANQKMMTDGPFQHLVETAGDVFVQGSASSALIRKLN
jgi:hypothetical protein